MTDQQQQSDDDDSGAAATFEAYVAELVSQLVDARSMADLDECTAIWKQMTLEARGLTPKQVYLDRCQVYKSQIQGKKMALERSEVITGGGSGSRTTVASTESKLVQQNVVLDQARKSLHETEDLAGEIAANLHSNRTTIQNAKTNTQTVSSLTTRAHQIADQLLKPWWKQALSK
jgi:hypothetical protein